MTCVPIDEVAEIDITGHRTDEAKPDVAAEIRFFRADDENEIDRAAVRLIKGRASHSWTATGLHEEEMWTRVRYEVHAENEVHDEGELVVFRPLLRVDVRDEQDRPVRSAVCRHAVRPIREAASLAANMRTKLRKRTNSSGYARFVALPGKTDLQILGPFDVVRWEKDTGPVRKVVVRRREVGARLLDPVAGEHKQWVNLPELPADRSRGLVLKFKVGGFGTDDVTPEGYGQLVHAKVRWLGGGTGRVFEDPPALDSASVAMDEEVTASAKLDRRHEAEFELCCGHGGGDVFEISVGMTPQCTDDEPATVTTWRKLYVRPLLAPPFEMPDSLPEVCAHVKEVYEPAFIDVEFEDAEDYDSDRVHDLSQQEIDAMGVKWAGSERYAVAQLEGHDKLETELQEYVRDSHDDRPRVYPIVVHAIVDVRTKGIKFSFRGRNSGWKKIAIAKHKGTFLPRLFDGSEPLAVKNGMVGFWKTRYDHCLYPADVETDFAKKRFRIRLPEDEGVKTLTSVRATLTVNCVGSQGGSSTGPMIGMAWKPGESASEFAHALCHEIGHSLEQSVKYPKPRMYGIDATNPNAYIEHGHQGRHCRTGLAARHVDNPGYHKLTGRGIHGNCVMWGGVGPDFDYERAHNFCEHCLGFLRLKKVAQWYV